MDDKDKPNTSEGEGKNTEGQSEDKANSNKKKVETEDRQEEINRIAGKVREEARLAARKEFEAEQAEKEKRAREEREAQERAAANERLVQEGKFKELVESKDRELQEVRTQLGALTREHTKATADLETANAQIADLNKAVTAQIKAVLKTLPDGTDELMPEGVEPAAQLSWLLRAQKRLGNSQNPPPPGNPPPPRVQNSPVDKPREDLVKSIVEEGRHSGKYTI